VEDTLCTHPQRQA